MARSQDKGTVEKYDIYTYTYIRVCGYIYRERESETDRQTETKAETDRQIDRQIGRQRQTDRQTDRETERDTESDIRCSDISEIILL